jgi:hypothetical protein
MSAVLENFLVVIYALRANPRWSGRVKAAVAPQ